VRRQSFVLIFLEGKKKKERGRDADKGTGSGKATSHISITPLPQ
jgi:hypothetical protein